MNLSTLFLKPLEKVTCDIVPKDKRTIVNQDNSTLELNNGHQILNKPTDNIIPLNEIKIPSNEVKVTRTHKRNCRKNRKKKLIKEYIDYDKINESKSDLNWPNLNSTQSSGFLAQVINDQRKIVCYDDTLESNSFSLKNKPNQNSEIPITSKGKSNKQLQDSVVYDAVHEPIYRTLSNVSYNAKFAADLEVINSGKNIKKSKILNDNSICDNEFSIKTKENGMERFILFTIDDSLNDGNKNLVEISSILEPSDHKPLKDDSNICNNVFYPEKSNKNINGNKRKRKKKEENNVENLKTTNLCDDEHCTDKLKFINDKMPPIDMCNNETLFERSVKKKKSKNVKSSNVVEMTDIIQGNRDLIDNKIMSNTDGNGDEINGDAKGMEDIIRDRDSDCSNLVINHDKISSNKLADNLTKIDRDIIKKDDYNFKYSSNFESDKTFETSMMNNFVDPTIAALEKEIKSSNNLNQKNKSGGVKKRKKSLAKLRAYYDRMQKQRERQKEREKLARSKIGTVICKYFSKLGSCNKGDECTYKHEIVKIAEPCKYYMVNSCSKFNNCQYYHSDWPCKFFHFFKCGMGENCRFSHALPTPLTLPLFEKIQLEIQLQNENKMGKVHETIHENISEIDVKQNISNQTNFCNSANLEGKVISFERKEIPQDIDNSFGLNENATPVSYPVQDDRLNTSNKCLFNFYGSMDGGNNKKENPLIQNNLNASLNLPSLSTKNAAETYINYYNSIDGNVEKMIRNQTSFNLAPNALVDLNKKDPRSLHKSFFNMQTSEIKNDANYQYDQKADSDLPKSQLKLYRLASIDLSTNDDHFKTFEFFNLPVSEGNCLDPRLQINKYKDVTWQPMELRIHPIIFDWDS